MPSSLGQPGGDVLCVENTVEVGAPGQRLGQALAQAGSTARVTAAAISHLFIAHASRDQILEAEGLTAKGITQTVEKLVIARHEAAHRAHSAR